MHDTVGIDLVAHGRRRPRRVRRRAAVPAGLHRRRQGRPRADRGDRRGHRRGLRAGRLRAARRRDRRAPRADGAATTTTSPATGVGVVEADDVLGPDRVRAGRRRDRAWPRPACTPTASRWPGTCCWTSARMPLDGHVEEFGRTLGEELLEPTRIYAKDCLALVAETDVHAVRAHHRRRPGRATWPGCCPRACTPSLDRGTWTPARCSSYRRARPGRARRDGADVQHGRRHGRRGRRPRTSTARWPCSPHGTCRVGDRPVCGPTERGRAAPPDRGHAVLAGDHPASELSGQGKGPPRSEGRPGAAKAPP